MVLAPGWRVFTHLCVAGGFAAVRAKPRGQSPGGVAAGLTDGGDTDAWAAGVLHRAGVQEIELFDRTVVPVLAPLSSVLK